MLGEVLRVNAEVDADAAEYNKDSDADESDEEVEEGTWAAEEAALSCQLTIPHRDDRARRAESLLDFLEATYASKFCHGLREFLRRVASGLGIERDVAQLLLREDELVAKARALVFAGGSLHDRKWLAEAEHHARIDARRRDSYARLAGTRLAGTRLVCI